LRQPRIDKLEAEVERLTIADFGGWAKVQPEHFGDGGIFDQIYKAQ
jgi:sulfate transport system substrate-binding protein